MSIFGFFESAKNKISPYVTRKNVNTLLQGYNVLVAALVFKDYIDHLGTEDEKNAKEYFGDIFIHLLQATVTYSSSLSHKGIALLANGYRLYNIPDLIAEGIATVPNPIALVDSVNHFINTAGTAATIVSELDQETAPKMA